MYWDVIEIKVVKHLTLYVRFADGTSGKVTFLPQHLVGVFEPLNDPEFFSQVFVDQGVITWPNEADLAPDTMYNEIKNHGEWILR